MNEEEPFFILAGNGPYENRGCEAIIRGTVKILRRYYKNPKFTCISQFDSDKQYVQQYQNEKDNGICHLSTNFLNKEKVISSFRNPKIWINLIRLYAKSSRYKYWVYENLLNQLEKSSAVLSVGGDNYSIDFGPCKLVTDLDDVVLEKNKAIFLWGSSIGPFNSISGYETYMAEHLKKVTGIFAREVVTIEYLKSIGVYENVYPVADPAFVMDSTKPKEYKDINSIEDEAIGINLSPLMAKYVTDGDIEKWKINAASIIENIAIQTEMPIYLIPHVTIPNSNDYEFMNSILPIISDKIRNITLVPPYNAEETKWIISQMSLFAGARTHATIAALSSSVPTISFGYSIKAEGINRDIFGHTDFVIPSNQLNSKNTTSKFKLITECQSEIKMNLQKKIPKIQDNAFCGGEHLLEILNNRKLSNH
jgi:polysaccharide pyruvyl transferase WcaK-like protein